VGGNCSPTRTAVSADISEQLQALPRGGGEVGFAADGEAIQFDVFGIASSRTMFLPAPPAGKVTVQLLATAVNAGIPGDFRFYFAAPEASEVFTTVSVPKGQIVPKGPELENGIAFVEPGKFYTVQVVYVNPSDREIEFLVSAPLVDPAAALPFARAICWCAAIPFSAPAGGAFYRTLKVGVGPNTPVGAKAIVEWPVIPLNE
jgi:hypothetical protein